jgi:hypothetical protein
MVNQVFSTPILREETDATEEELASLCDRIVGLYNAGPEAVGGEPWISQGNLFAEDNDGQLNWVRAVIAGVLTRYLRDVFSVEGEVEWSLSGQAVITRMGDWTAPHSAPGALLAGLFHIAIPEGMDGGELVFEDPRFNVAGFETPQMREAGIVPAWHQRTIEITPWPGEITLFPAWLAHYAKPFRCDDLGSACISIAFTATP